MRPSPSSTSLSKSSLKSSSSSLSPSSSILGSSLPSSSSHPPSHAAPTTPRQSTRHTPVTTLVVPPRTSPHHARHSKLEHIIQNFYTKVAQIIVIARQPRDRTSTRKRNKWFNLGTDDVEWLRDDLRYWRTLAVHASGEEPPPMLMEVYVDAAALRQHHIALRSGQHRVDLSSGNTQRIVLEAWELTLNHPWPGSAVDLPSLYKRSIVFFRSLHSFARLLPCYLMHRHVNLRVRLRSSPARACLDEIPLDIPLLDHGLPESPISSYAFSDVVTPLGIFRLQVRYRPHCSVQKDIDKDMGATYVDMDEHFFTPTMARYRQAHHDSLRSGLQDQGSTRDPVEANRPRLETLGLGTGDQLERPRRSSTASQSSARSLSSTSRHPLYSLDVSANTLSNRVSPFKSPSLSSSPLAETMLSSSRQAPSPIEKSRSTGLDSLSSRKIEFSSSFEKFKDRSSSPSRLEAAGGVSMVRRWSRQSDQSSVHLEPDDADLEDFMKFVGGNHDLKLFQNTAVQQWMESTSLSPASETSSSLCVSGHGSGSIHRSKKSLSHFKNLRDTHNHLSESLSSSTMGPGLDTRPELSTTVGTSLGSSSSSSSQGRLHIPVVPSPLHADHASTLPVHIPSHYHRPSSSIPTTAATTHSAGPPAPPAPPRLHSSLAPSGDCDMDQGQMRGTADEGTSETTRSALFGRYFPGDDRSMRDMRHCESQTNLSEALQSGTTGGARASVVDDDDSLVFKMSELESSSQPSTSFPANDTSIVFHRSLPEGRPNTLAVDRGLRRIGSSGTLSQPVAGMATVPEEEEKSASASSTKSEPVKATKPNTMFYADW